MKNPDILTLRELFLMKEGSQMKPKCVALLHSLL